MSVFSTIYDHGILTKYTVAFGTLFNNMTLIRKNEDSTEFERYNIPLMYSPKEKFIQRTQSDPELLRKESITFPRMAFELVGLSYDPSRNLNQKQLMGLFNATDPNNKIAFYSPAPYNLSFELYITTKTITEMLQIVEQILPAFKPDYHIAIKLLDNTSRSIDVPISLMSEFGQDTYDGEINTQRTIIWTLQFLVKAYLFGPIKSYPVIKQSNFNVYNMAQIDSPDSELISEASLTATVIVAGKTLEEIYETDDWTIETIFGV